MREKVEREVSVVELDIRKSREARRLREDLAMKDTVVDKLRKEIAKLEVEGRRKDSENGEWTREREEEKGVGKKRKLAS